MKSKGFVSPLDYERARKLDMLKIRCSVIFSGFAYLLVAMAGPSAAFERVINSQGESVIEPKAKIIAYNLAKRQAPKGVDLRNIEQNCYKQEDRSYKCESSYSFEVPDDDDGQSTAVASYNYGRTESDEPVRSRRRAAAAPVLPSKPSRVNRSDQDAYDSYMSSDSGQGIRRDGTLLPSTQSEPIQSTTSVSDEADTLGAAASGVKGLLDFATAALPLATGIAAQRNAPIPRSTNNKDVRGIPNYGSSGISGGKK
ncbi:hypothetical protein [Methylobacterium thuringiense]|nr:hypothetical protein [Methylobacterium thuringiense]